MASKTHCVSHSLHALSQSGLSANSPKNGLKQAPALLASVQLLTEAS